MFRRGQAEVVLDEDNDNVLDTIKVGDGVGELGLLLGTKRTVTVRCTGPCEVFAITRESYETAVALLPEAARGGDLVLIMKKFWTLATFEICCQRVAFFRSGSVGCHEMR